MTIARYLLSEKLAGQRQLLPRLTAADHILEAIEDAAVRLDQAVSINELVMAERDAALAYWAAWKQVQVRFSARDRERIPDGWCTFGQRGSPLTNSSRLAVNPANALLNYCYALLEAETTVALQACGLDPTLGIVHADQRSRPSLALDVMEPARPAVDRYLFDLLEHQVFRASDFHETRKGSCRILPPLTHTLAETAPAWGRLVAPVAERVAALLDKATRFPHRPAAHPAHQHQPARWQGRHAPSPRSAAG